jgi:hypothetical protein
MKCLSHSKRDGDRTEQCEGQHVKVHWLYHYFSHPDGQRTEKRLLPAVVSQPGRQRYDCWQMIHVKTRSDLQTDDYSVQLMTLYDSARWHSFIMNEVALAQMLRYVQVPERSVEILENHRAKTTKLFILDVKPRSAAKTAEALMVSAYGVDNVELTVGAAPRLDLLRRKFDQRPGKLSIASADQPAGMVHLVIGKNNLAFMPTVIAQSVRGGSDLYFMRNDLFPGEMLFGETDTSSSRKKGAASGSKQTLHSKA